MAETKLTLVKSRKKQTPSLGKVAKKQTRTSERSLPLGPIISLPILTRAERTEADRFKGLTAAKAARQAMLHRILAELQELDETESAA